jgi:hypothetical protein
MQARHTARLGTGNGGLAGNRTYVFRRQAGVRHFHRAINQADQDLGHALRLLHQSHQIDHCQIIRHPSLPPTNAPATGVLSSTQDESVANGHATQFSSCGFVFAVNSYAATPKIVWMNPR